MITYKRGQKWDILKQITNQIGLNLYNKFLKNFLTNQNLRNSANQNQATLKTPKIDFLK